MGGKFGLQLFSIHVIIDNTQSAVDWGGVTSIY